MVMQYICIFAEKSALDELRLPSNEIPLLHPSLRPTAQNSAQNDTQTQHKING